MSELNTKIPTIKFDLPAMKFIVTHPDHSIHSWNLIVLEGLLCKVSRNTGLPLPPMNSRVQEWFKRKLASLILEEPVVEEVQGFTPRI